jgi:hypothetical protein
LEGILFYDCIGNSEDKQSLLLATTLRGFNRIDIEVFFEELAAAEKGDVYEEIYHPDALTDDFRVLLQSPTVGIADGTFFMSVQVFRELLEEWFGFMGS